MIEEPGIHQLIVKFVVLGEKLVLIRSHLYSVEGIRDRVVEYSGWSAAIERGQALYRVDRLSINDHVSTCGSVNQKQLPCPIVLSTPIEPPCASISDFAIANPRPLPPLYRARDLSPR